MDRAGLIILLACAGLLHAQAPVVTATTPAYDAVSIKPNKAGDGRTMIRQGQSDYSGSNIRVIEMLRFAYGVTTEDQVSGIPGWAATDHWDVEAKMDAETVAAQKKMSKEDSDLQRRAMMQKMLAERFKLTVHHEQKEMTVYNLVIAKGGPKLKEADAAQQPVDEASVRDGKMRGGMMRVEMGKLTANGVPIANLAMFLAQTQHKQVVDKTGLTGKYDIELRWTPDDMPTGAEAHAATGTDTNAPSIYTALQEQLGLRLETVKGLVDTIVVDHIEMPTEN
jgi:uncharacterized protein (TIGR03435 family)